MREHPPHSNWYAQLARLAMDWLTSRLGQLKLINLRRRHRRWLTNDYRGHYWREVPLIVVCSAPVEQWEVEQELLQHQKFRWSVRVMHRSNYISLPLCQLPNGYYSGAVWPEIPIPPSELPMPYAEKRQRLQTVSSTWWPISPWLF